MRDQIKVSFPGGMKVNAEYKGFILKTDQPPYAGGDGSAPAPFDLFLGSIATCAGYYVLAFCQKRGIPTDRASLTMSTQKNPEKRMIEKVLLELHLPEEFPEKYTQAIIRSVDTCSVKAHIQKAPAFEVKVRIG